MRTRDWLLAASVFVCSTVVGACAAPVDDTEEIDTETSEAAASIASTSTFFSVRQDFRRCASPMCGGYFVKRMNRISTQCNDGTWASECYVAEIDWSAAGLTASDADVPRGIVVRGSIRTKDFGAGRRFGAFSPSEVWSAGTYGVAATGSVYRVGRNGLMCFRAPCPDKTADKLNSYVTRLLSDVSGPLAGDVTSRLATEKVLASGAVYATRNGGRTLYVTQYWTRVAPKPADPLACDVDADCTRTEYATPVTTASACYCPMCPSTIANVTAAAHNQSTWQALCSETQPHCPIPACQQPPPVACVNHKCENAPPPACRTPSVPTTDTYYARFEAPHANNACAADGDCMVSGCSSEICAADSMVSTCEALPRGPAGACGCVAGQCQWHTSGACN